jgi:hypothetical protein
MLMDDVGDIHMKPHACVSNGVPGAENRTAEPVAMGVESM